MNNVEQGASYNRKEVLDLIKKHSISETTFYRRVKSGEIKSYLHSGKKRGAEFDKDDVDKMIQANRPLITKLAHTAIARQQVDKGEIDWVKESDLPYLLAIDLELYGIENTVDISITHGWWKKNPNACLILFNEEDRREIWGGITIIPMKEETIFKLLNDEMQEKQITPDDILVYEPGGKYCGYVASAVIRPEHRTSFIRLIHTFLKFFCDSYPDIQISKLYGFAASDEGYDLIKKLFFAPRYDIGDNAFELDPYRRNPSRLIQVFQECIRAKEQQVAS